MKQSKPKSTKTDVLGDLRKADPALAARLDRDSALIAQPPVRGRRSFEIWDDTKPFPDLPANGCWFVTNSCTANRL